MLSCVGVNQTVTIGKPLGDGRVAVIKQGRRANSIISTVGNAWHRVVLGPLSAGPH